MEWEAVSCMMSAPWGLMEPLAKWELWIFPWCPCAYTLAWYSPQLPPVDFAASSSVYCQLQGLVSFFPLSVPMGISWNISNPLSAATAAVPDVQLLALLALVKESILLKSSLAWNCNSLPILKLLWVLPLRKWCVRLLGKCSRQGYMILTVHKSHYWVWVASPYSDIIRNPKL